MSLACLTVSVAAEAEAAGGGKVRFVRNATSAFDHTLVHSSARQRRWMASHYWRMRGYAPFFNRALKWAPPAHLYKDLYAIYRDRAADRRLLTRHPSWVLRDGLVGRPLYIPWGCGGGSCPQYAADIGNPQWRAHWISRAREVMAKGYAGIYIDDVNMLMRVSNGSGGFVRPFDPRTLAPMTDANWRRYVAEFTEQIRAAFPRAEITHNAIWWVDRSDPYVGRQVDAADFVELERGFNDGGIVGSGAFGYETYLGYVDWVHSRGASVMYEPYGLNARSRQFELASYFLGRARRDAIASAHRADPGDWWRGWSTKLGAPLGPRYAWSGLLRRDFQSGTVLVNPPGAPPKVVALPGKRWRDGSGKRVRSLTLGGRAGKVVMRGRPTR